MGAMNGEEKVLNTGVQPQEAAADEEETEVTDDTPEVMEEESPEISLEELLNGDDEGNAEKGLDSPPSQKPKEEPKQATQTEPAQKTFTQAELDTIVQKRLKQQSDSIAKKAAADKAAEAEVEKQAKQYIVDHPEMENQPELVKAFIKMQQPQAEPVDDGVERYTAEEHEASRKKAWQESLTSEEPELRETLGDPNFSIREAVKKDSPNYHPVLANLLAMGLTPNQAGYVMKQAEKYYGDKAAAAAEKELLQNIRTGNAKAVTPAPAAKGTAKTTSAEKFIREAPYSELKAMINKAGEKGIYLGDR